MRSRAIGAGQTGRASQLDSARDDGRGAGFLLAHQQLGALSLATAPTNGQTVSVVVNGTTITATASASPTNPNDIYNPGTALGFATNVLNWLRRPDLTNANQIAASGANQLLLSYVGWAWPGSGTTIVPFSLNKNVNGITGALTSFNITTTVTSGSWAAQTMELYIQDGTYFVNGTRYFFTGGSTPTVTAPVSHPRIDVLTIDNTGTLAWTTGTENASPTAPAYPANKIAICELYNVVGETGLFDNENQQSGQGYISNDVRSFLNFGANFGALPDDILPDVTDTRQIGSSAGLEFLNVYAKNIYAANLLQLDGVNVANARFGGTGVDGALSITSGTTTLSAGSANIFVKNYTSISITGTAFLNFSNPHANGTNIILKSQGNVTITSSASPCIDAGSMGTVGGTAGVGVGSPSNATGPIASSGSSMVAAGSSTNNSSVTGSAPGSSNAAYGTLSFLLGSSAPVAQGSVGFPFAVSITISGKTINICPSTGGSGSGGNNQSGSPQNGNAGGAGAGALYIECAGALDFTGTINANGIAGGTATSRSGNGGGGAGGIVLIVYNTLTANSGTINTNGGGSPAGANGASLVTKNDEFS